MPETPKKNREVEKGRTDEQKKDSWSEDQETREYYYDDAHGYEVYQPEKDDEPDDDKAQ